MNRPQIVAVSEPARYARIVDWRTEVNVLQLAVVGGRAECLGCNRTALVALLEEEAHRSERRETLIGIRRRHICDMHAIC